MKKIIIYLTIIFIANTAKAQSNITDTTQYLRDSIQNKRNDYSNTLFSFFLSHLQLGIKYYSVAAPLPSTPSPVTVDKIILSFNTIDEIITKELQNKKSPTIEVVFTSPISFPKSYLEKGGILDWGTDWNSTKANFFANKVIFEINVNGL